MLSTGWIMEDALKKVTLILIRLFVNCRHKRFVCGVIKVLHAICPGTKGVKIVKIKKGVG